MKRIAVIVFCVLMLASAAFAQEMAEVRDQASIFEKGYILVKGKSATGQEESMAERAAVVIAQRNLLETIQGLNLAGETSIVNNVGMRDIINTKVVGRLRGATPVKVVFDEAKGNAVAWVRYNLKGTGGLYDAAAPVLQGAPAKLGLEELPAFKPETAPAPQPKTYDGLIVIVEGTGFKPALANRIVTESQDILFEPSKVSPRMLIERGCGGYTTTQDKAKALLASWGSKSPLVVKCVKVMKGTEAVISVKDATVIFEQDQKTNMLPQAKVVFVL
jgi:hypothetical protein